MTRRVFTQGALLFTAPAKPANLRDMEKRVFDAINNQRGHAGIADLIWSSALADAAREQSGNMMERGFFAHVDPLRGDLAMRLNAGGIGWIRCGENLFTEKGYIEPVWTAVVEWMHSPGHKQNILEAEFTHSGVGIARSDDARYFMTQVFTRPPRVTSPKPR
ncbi:MAG: CAP domain-containing protein [Acidobacteriota bacterium]|nr:CAP domain-containing protein [Acidobacteriota bacterium]